MAEVKDPYDTWHDKEEWRKQRDAKLMNWIGNADAVNLFLDLSDVAEIIDDLWDGDKEVYQWRAERLAFKVFVDIPSNPFMIRYGGLLNPILNQGVHLWLDANQMERNAKNGEDFDHNLNRSYIFRDFFGTALNTIIEICRGREYLRLSSKEINDFFFSETLEEYKSKFNQNIIAETTNDGE